MAELAGLLLGAAGLLPVIVEIVQAYKTVHRGIIAVLGCTRELKLIELDLKVQEQRFLNELEILLQHVDKDARARDMIDDPAHPLWHDKDLDKRVRQSLDRSYALCVEIIESIKEVLQELSESLTIFDEVREQRQKAESLRKTFKRLRKALKFDRKEYERYLDRLRKGNEDLEALRNQAAILDQHKEQLKRDKPRKSIPSHIAKNQSLSTKAYAALAASFKCNDLAHAQHLAAVSLDIGFGEWAHIDMAIYYVSSSLTKNRLEDPLRFLLQPRQLDERYSLLQPACSPPALQPAVSIRNIQTSPTTRPADEREPVWMEVDPDRRRKANQRLRVTKESPNKRVMTETSLPSQNSMGPAINLSHIESTCQYLRQKCVTCLRETDTSRSFIGFFEPSHSPGYCFYVLAKQRMTSHLEVMSDSEFAIALDKILNDQRDTVTNLHQYKIALKLVMAVLQYHSTPWLREVWHLSDLLLHCNSDSFPEDVPLFLQSSLAKDMQPLNSLVLPKNSTRQQSQLQVRLKRHRGINNMFTFSLGVALLEIAYMKPLSELRVDAEEDEIDIARRIADASNPKLSRLGKGYQEIIRKCLSCDFGCGSDLGKAELRQAIYNDIACPIQEIVEKLEDLGI